MKRQHQEHIRLVPEPFTPMHLLRLAETVKDIDCKAFTMAMAESLRIINNPPIIMEQKLNINVPTDELNK